MSANHVLADLVREAIRTLFDARTEASLKIWPYLSSSDERRGMGHTAVKCSIRVLRFAREKVCSRRRLH